MKHFVTRALGLLLAGLLVLLLAGLPAQAQMPAWQTAMGLGQATGSSVVAGMATDASGNVYVAGSFVGTVSFGATSFTSNSTAFSTYQEAFVAKWSPLTNSFVWAQSLGRGSYCQATAVAVSGSTVYVAGNFSGAGTFGTSALTSSGTQDGFVVKLTDTGSTAALGWAQRASAQFYTGITALAVSGTSVYATGKFNGTTATFGSHALANPSAYYNFTGYIAKLTDAGSSGSFAWAELVGGLADAVAASGTSVYVAGGFGSTGTFGSTVVTGAGGHNAYIAKFTDAGPTASLAWTQQAGGSGTFSYAHVHALAVSGASVYAVGGFGGVVGGSPVSFGATTLTSFDYKSAFVAKLDDAGTSANFAWAQRAGGRAASGSSYAADSATALAVRGSSVYVAGSFNSPVATFGNQTLTNSSRTSANRRWSDVFVSRLTDAGTSAGFAWAQQAGGQDADFMNALVVSGSGIYTTGGILSTAAFGSLSIANPTNSYVGFLASLTDPTLTATTPEALRGAAFSLYPNPAHSTATLLLPALPATATLTLRDALGRALRTTTVLPTAGLRQEVDLSGLPAGIYAAQVQVGTATATRRLVVE